MKVKLKNVMANPFRDMDRYPIHPQKILQLKASINSTGFWDNVVARQSPDTNGKIELAYGHHRWTALMEMANEGATILIDGKKKKLSMSTEFDWIVRALDDEEMLKIMAHENLDEWGHDASIERETIRAVVKAFADDRIDLAKPKADMPKSKMRYAPSFCFGLTPSAESAQRPYNADTINGFLGGTMSARTIQYTLQALCLMEKGHLSESDLSDLSTNECRVIVEETERSIKQAASIKAETERLARNAATPILEKQIRKDGEKRSKAIVKDTATAVAKTLKTGSQSGAREAARDVRVKTSGGKEKQLPEINTAGISMVKVLKALLSSDSANGKKLDSLIKHKKHMGSETIHALISGLTELIEWAEGYKCRLESALNEGEI